MSGDGSVTLAWGDGEYKFRLGIGELRELQEKTGVGPFVIMRRLAEGTWLVDDVMQPLRLGLIGGGMDPQKALGKVGKYVVPARFLYNVMYARTVLHHGLFGDPEDPVGKEQAAAAAAQQTTDSDSQTSSEQPQQWDGPLPNSTAAAFGNSPQPLTAGTSATVQRMNGPNQ